ncbi:MAG: serine/threonine-protein kinase [Kofleriaceae bacterium]
MTVDLLETEPAGLEDEWGDTQIGRYVLRRFVGAGGMGAVFAAHDPELDREVAIKMFATESETARPIREAQAMARLSHPNVVQIYEVIRLGPRTAIVMELVRGGTLRAWCEASPRSWRDIVRHYLDAARGVAAAHEAGIVHRDFKPDNVLLGDDGVVRVVDFGLAVAAGDGHPFAGTPAYMAPEQRDGVIGPAIDQYAFAVALWEVVTGTRPDGPDAPSRGGPAWLFGVLRRALAVKPAARFRPMNELITALERGLVRRRNVVLASAALLALGTTAALAASLTEGSRLSCETSRAAVDRVWNLPSRYGLAGRLATSPRLNAQATSERVVASLDRRAVRLADAREDTCSAHGGAVGDRITACLDRQIVVMGAMIVQLARADDSAIDHAVAAVESMPEAMECSASATATAARGAPAPILRVLVDLLQARHAAAEALAASGHLPEARIALDVLARQVRAVGYAPLVADVELTRARTIGALNDSVVAAAAYQLAATAAARVGDDHALARAWIGLVDETADAGSPHDALRDLHFAEVAVDRANAPELREKLSWARANVELGTGDLAAARRTIETAVASVRARGAEHTLHGAGLLQQLGRTLYKSGDPEHAAEADRGALEIYIDLLGPEHTDVARVLGNLAIDLNERGSTVEARALLERALAIKERTLGPDDLATASTLQGLVVVASRAGQFEDAIRYGERIRDIRERRLGPAHPLLASELSNLAGSYLIAGRIDDAEAAARRALAIREKANGLNHDSVAYPLQHLAAVHVKRGQPAAALPLLERARDILEHTVGRTKTRTGVVWNAIGDTERALGHEDRACAAWTTAVSIVEHDAGPDDHRLIPPLGGVASCKLRANDPGAARDAAERVTALCRRAGLPPYSAGPAHLVHARTLAADPAHRAEAVAELEIALRSYDGAPPSLDSERAEVRTWLARLAPRSH